jgi:hypothetical protein
MRGVERKGEERKGKKRKLEGPTTFVKGKNIVHNVQDAQSITCQLLLFHYLGNHQQ